MIRSLLICCLIPAAAGLAAAQPPPEPPRKLLLSPNQSPTPVLRFSLLPELRDQEPGDAWPLYKKAGEMLSKLPPNGSERAGIFDTIDGWSKMPYAELPRDAARKILAIFREPLALVEKASRCESCNCEVPQRIREKGVNALLTEVQEMRSAIQVLCLKARLELAEDQPEKALRTLRVGYSIGQRVGESSTLVSVLVGVAISTVANNTLQEVLTHPKAPNLYWALTNLPQPFLSMHNPMEGERLGAYSSFPRLLEVSRNADAGAVPEEQLKKGVKAFVMLDGRPDNIAFRVLLAQQIRAQHETAKNALIAAGRPREKVDAWPHLQVALMFGLMEFDQHLDEMMKWDSFLYHESAQGLEEAVRKVRSLRGRPLEMRAFPLASTMLPATEKVFLARARLERQFAALRCVEAIRLYAAGHGGKLPASLTEIKEGPLPTCPVTGKSFAYRVEGDTALLSAPEVLPPARPTIQPLAYEITIRR